MKISRATLAQVMVRMFFVQHQNTAQIARRLEIPEWSVDRVIAHSLDMQAKRDKAP